MFTLAVRRKFIARHALIGGDWGRENLPNSHQYLLELQLEGADLDQHGFLVDIVDVERSMDEVVTRFGDKFLNDLPEFAGLNPSLEHFARTIWMQLQSSLKALPNGKMRIVLWEDELAWVAYTD